MTELFANGETSATLRAYAGELECEIKGLSNEKVLGGDLDEWVNYYFEEYKIQPISLYMENVSQILSETKVKQYNPFSRNDGYEPEYYMIDGYKITFTIPYDGDNELLFLRPSTFFLSRFPVEDLTKSTDKSYGEIIFALEYTKQELEKQDNPKDFIKEQFNQKIKNYVTNVTNINSEVMQFNNSLENTIKKALDTRKSQAKDYIRMGEKLAITLTLNPNAPNTTPILLKKTIVDKPKMPNIKQPEKEYQISSQDFDNIRRIIDLAGFSMEKAAKTFSKLSEEELRDIFISNLNTHYQGQVTGETFSKVGKTDIHILFDNKAAYIAECKIWHGQSNFNEAINQLFSYITWRDLKTSIIIFNKENKDFNKLLSVINTSLQDNDTCKKHIAATHNEWLCEFSKNKESEERVVVQVVVFDICTE